MANGLTFTSRGGLSPSCGNGLLSTPIRNRPPRSRIVRDGRWGCELSGMPIAPVTPIAGSAPRRSWPELQQLSLADVRAVPEFGPLCRP